MRFLCDYFYLITVHSKLLSPFASFVEHLWRQDELLRLLELSTLYKIRNNNLMYFNDYFVI